MKTFLFRATAGFAVAAACAGASADTLPRSGTIAYHTGWKFSGGVLNVADKHVQGHGTVSGVTFNDKGAGPDRSGFLSAFFTLVGTHGVHVSSGLIWILVLLGQVMVKGLSLPVTSRLFRLGLFWHFLDIAWVGIFSVVYLPGLL